MIEMTLMECTGYIWMLLALYVIIPMGKLAIEDIKKEFKNNNQLKFKSAPRHMLPTPLGIRKSALQNPRACSR